MDERAELAHAQERYLRAVRGAENWMGQLVSRRREIPLELIRAYLMLKYGIHRPALDLP